MSEFAGWAAEMLTENHAVVNSEDMSVLPCLFIDGEITDRCRCTIPAAAFVGFFLKVIPAASAGCRSPPFWVVFSIVSSVRAIQMLAAFAFTFCFQFLLAALFAAMLMESCLLFSGIERVRAFNFSLLLDPGFFEHAVHVWKGKLAKMKVKRMFSS